MAKVGVVVFADTESHENLARAVNALLAVKEFKEAGDEVKLIFDGAGTRWIGELSKSDHRAHGWFEAVKDKVGVCSYCAAAFGAKEAVQASGLPLLAEYQQHPSLRKLVAEGYEVITF